MRTECKGEDKKREIGVSGDIRESVYDVPPDDLDTECAEGVDGVHERDYAVEAGGMFPQIWMQEITVLGLARLCQQEFKR